MNETSAAVADDVATLELAPSLDEVRELAREHNLVPLRHTFIADCETPVSAYLKLRGAGPSFLLESAEQGQRVGRWSFLGFRPRAVIRLDRGAHTDPYALVAEELERYRIAPLAGLPPFAGGAVGLFGYDLVRTAEPTVGEPNRDDTGVPELALMVTDVLLAFDHLRHEVTVLANVLCEDELERSYDEAVAAIADVRRRLRGPAPAAERGRREPPDFASNLGSEGYAAAVERAKEYIRAGDIYQVVPSQRWSAGCPVDAFSIYRGLRAVNPSPYMYFLDFEDFEIAGASPESLVKVSGRRVEQRPIAGTRPRAGSTEQDIERARELLADEKERAEHVMLVDLGRNDLGRVCEYGSVRFGICADDPQSRFLEQPQRARQVGHHGKRRRLRAASGNLTHRGVQLHGAILGNHDGERAAGIRCAQAGTQVVRVLDTIEPQHQRPRPVAVGRLLRERGILPPGGANMESIVAWMHGDEPVGLRFAAQLQAQVELVQASHPAIVAQPPLRRGPAPAQPE